jgi:hypothetical protein
VSSREQVLRELGATDDVTAERVLRESGADVPADGTPGASTPSGITVTPEETGIPGVSSVVFSSPEVGQ